MFLIIHKNFYFHLRTLSETYGLWDTVSVDGRKEFDLLVFIQQFLSHMRNDISRLPIHRRKNRQSHKMVKHAQTIRRQIADESFECV